MNRAEIRTLTKSRGNKSHVLALCVTLAWGCSSAPKASLEPADVGAHVRYALGTTPMAPDGEQPPSLTFEGAHWVTFEVFVLEELPETALRPISEQTSLAFVLDEGQPLVAPMYIARGARAGQVESREALLESLGSNRLLSHLAAALPQGVQATFRLRSTGSNADTDSDPMEAEKPALGLETHHGGISSRDRSDPDTISFTWYLEGFGPRVAAFNRSLVSDRERADPIGESFRTEVLLTGSFRVGEGLQFAAMFVSPFEGGVREAILAIVTVKPAPTPRDADFDEYEAALSACRNDMDAFFSAREAEHVDRRQTDEAREVEAAFRALAAPGNRRATLAFLARTTGASIAEDLALSASDERVNALVERILRMEPTRKPTEELGWLLVVQLLGEVVELQQNGELTPEVLAVLTRHTGEAGLHSLFLVEAVDSCKNLQQLEARLAEENTLYLHNPSLGVRIRAYRWLEARGLAPRGYEPGTYFEEGKSASLEEMEKARVEPARFHE